MSWTVIWIKMCRPLSEDAIVHLKVNLRCYDINTELSGALI